MKLTTMFRITALLLLAGPFTLAETPQLTPRDVAAANAIVEEKVRLETWVKACKAEVPEVAPNGLNVHERFDAVFADWKRVNFDYLDVAGIIRNDQLEAIKTSQGPSAMSAVLDEMTRKISITRRAAQAALDELPQSKREGKCYGIMTTMVQGKLDIPAVLVADSKHIESRLEVMGW